MQWTMPRIASPESYLRFGGLFCLSSALRRNVVIPAFYEDGTMCLASWSCWPNMYISYVGPPAETYKSTAMDAAIEILEEVPILHRGPNTASKPSLLAELVDAEENAIYITSRELSDLITTAGPEMYEFLTSIYDGHKSFKSTTISRGVELVNKPCLNLIAATTPVWLTDTMPEPVIGGGFSSRMIWVYEDKPRWKKVIHHDTVFPDSMHELKDALVHDLKHISTQINGEFRLTDECADFINNFNNNMKIPKATKLSGYYGRKIAHMLKIAMLLKLSKTDELVLEKKDCEESLDVLATIEPKLGKVFEGVGKNVYTMSAKNIVEYIKDNNRVNRSDLLRAFEAAAEPAKLDELINGLVNAMYISAYEDSKTGIYYTMKKERVT